MHVTVGICTYRRPVLLGRLLEALERQETAGGCTFSIVVADNDVALSARPVVEAFAARSRREVVYCSEPRRNIAYARNCAVKHARGDFVAWIDDDEFPACGWLAALVSAVSRYGAAGVLGPVRPHFDARPPQWLIDGRFCERAEYASGTLMHWSRSFAGNCIVRLELLRQQVEPFDGAFGLGGEDVDFFRRMTAQGHTFVWCSEAMVYEVVPPCRWTRRYRLRRALLLGRSSFRLGGAKALLKSFIAIPAYGLALPLTALFGHHVLMTYGIKLTSHVGRVLAWLHLNPITERPE